MNNKSGFALVELLIALFIASLLGALLFSVQQQITNLSAGINAYVQLYEQAERINAIFLQDISGAFVPYWAPKQKKETSSAPMPIPDEKKKQEKEPEKPTEKKKEKKSILPKLFIIQKKDKQTMRSSFISNNPLSTYWGSNWGTPPVRVARIVYFLEPEKKVTGKTQTYRLKRQQGTELTFKSYADKKIPAYTLAENIRSFSIQAGVVETEDDQETIAWYKSWDSDEQQKKRIFT